MSSISRKVILTGSFGVGKTSLFNQFVYNKFDDKYLTTIGVKVNKKTIEIDGDEINIMLWDIAGEVSQDKVPISYFLGSSAIFYVFDSTRPSTYKNIEQDIQYLKSLMPDVLIRIVANKKDLLTEAQLNNMINEVALPINAITSAKTGENVQELFYSVGKALMV